MPNPTPRTTRVARIDFHGRPSPSSTESAVSAVSETAGVAPPSGTSWSDSLQLTQYSQPTLFLAPQLGQTRKSGCFVAFMISFTLYRQLALRQRNYRPPAHPVWRWAERAGDYRQTPEP